MEKLCYSLLILLIVGCQNSVEQKVVIENDEIEQLNESMADTTQEVIEIKVKHPIANNVKPININKHLQGYNRLKSSIKTTQRQTKNRSDITDSAKIKLAQDYTSNILIDSMFQYWLGTEWDFNGYTATPRKGLIACGYFVSTTLKHCGFELNRYKVAQKAAAEIIAELCDTSAIEMFYSIPSLEEYLKNKQDREIFVVGLNYHVGFVFRENTQNFFVHSNYIDRAGVMIEPFENSDALKNSNIYYIGSLTANKAIFENWIK